ncbi:ABC transporter substrate-binding protein [Myxococcaceae bacterium GXIMD 01537]
MRRANVKRRLGWMWVCTALLAGCPKGKEEVPDAGAPAEVKPDALSEKEPNERPEQALAIPRDAVVTAALAADPSKADEDWYRLAPEAGARMADVAVTGIPGTDLTLEVYDGDRYRLAGINSEGDGKPERFPNLYVERERWVRVAPARKGSGGAYTLTVTYRPANDGEEREPNDRAVDAHVLPLGQTVTAYLGHAGDADWYRVELPAPATPEPAPAPTPTEPPPGTAPAPTEGAPPAPTEAAPGSPPPPEGSAEAVPQEGAAPPAEAPLAEDTGAGQVVAQAAAQALGQDAGPPPAAPEPPAVALKIELSGIQGVSPELEVLSEAEAQLFLTKAKEGEALSLRNIGVRGTDRVVYVVVRGGWTGTGKDARRTFNAGAPYTLTVSQEEAGANAELEPNNEWAKATPMSGAGFKEGFLSPKGDVDYFVLKTAEPSLVRAELSGVERLDLVLSAVEPPAGDGLQETVVVRANEGEVKEPERLNNVVCNGTCYFKVEGASRKVDGKWVREFENAEVPYRLTLTPVPDTGNQEREPNGTADRAMELTFGKAVRGTVYPKKDVDYFRLDLSDRPVRTPLKATLLGILKVDVGLYLHRLGEDGKLTLVQTSDRAKGDQPESIRYSAEPGVYVLEVRDAKNREANFQDAYQLLVEEGE